MLERRHINWHTTTKTWTEVPTGGVTLTWHASKYKVHKLHPPEVQKATTYINSVTDKVPGEIKRSRGGRWSWTFKLAQTEKKVGLLSLRVVPQQQCGNGRCPCDSAQARQLKQQLRRDTAVNTSIVLAAVHGLSSLFRHAVISPRGTATRNGRRSADLPVVPEQPEPF